jgi:nucleoside-diphosphate-sugar epimerase
VSRRERLLLTGGAGFIGSHVADQLVAAGFEVAVVDNLRTGRREQVPAGAQFFPYDIKAKEAFDLVLSWQPRVILHFAAQMSVTFSVKDPLGDAQENILGSLNLFNAAAQAGVVAIFTEKFLAGQQPVINGDGRQTRDFLYVGDAAAAAVLALDYSQPGVFNIGTGIETDILTLYLRLQQLTGSPLGPVHGPAKPGEQRRSALDSNRAREYLGWQPLVLLEEGLKRTVAAFRKTQAASWP